MTATGGIESGDVVQLKSGGPVMTVEWTDPERGAYCVWFAGHQEKGHVFAITSLAKVDQSNSGGTVGIVRG
jgi:uncharacterized protein YodC (DUF2158 family)